MKKLILLLLFSWLFANSHLATAQDSLSFQFIDGYTGQVIIPWQYVVNCPHPMPPFVVFNQNDSIWIKNVSSTTKQVKCKKVLGIQAPGSSNYFSWDTLYAPDDSISNAIEIPSGEVFKNFRGYYSSSNQWGITDIHYYFFDANNPNDFIHQEVIFVISDGINEELARKIKIFPSPTNDYIYINGIKDPSVEILNILGSVVLQIKSEKILICDLPAGVYFCRVKKGNQEILTKKFLKY